MVKLKNQKYHTVIVDDDISDEYRVKLKGIKEGEKISIMWDGMFKTMFVHPNRVKYGAKLLSYFIDVPYEKLLANLHFINSELGKDKVISKGERCDYVAKIGDSIINIEVNCNSSKKTLERNLEYSHRLFATRIKSGSDYEYTQTIQLNLNNFVYKNCDEIVDIFYIQNDKNIKLTNKMIYINIYIPNLIKKCYNTGINDLSEMERFILSLVEINIEKAKEYCKGDKFMKDCVKEQVEFCLDDDLRESYDHELADREQERIYARAEGLAEGLEEGVKQGERNIINNLISSGMSTEEISKIINITVEEIENLLAQPNENK